MSDYCVKRLLVFSFDYEFDTHVSLYKGHTAVVVSTERVLGDSQVNVVEAIPQSPQTNAKRFRCLHWIQIFLPHSVNSTKHHSFHGFL